MSLELTWHHFDIFPPADDWSAKSGEPSGSQRTDFRLTLETHDKICSVYTRCHIILNVQ